MTTRRLYRWFAAIFAATIGVMVAAFALCCQEKYVASYVTYGLAATILFGGLIRTTIVYQRAHPAPPGGYPRAPMKYRFPASVFFSAGMLTALIGMLSHGERSWLLGVQDVFLALGFVFLFVGLRAVRRERESMGEGALQARIRKSAVTRS
jgi:hypothetical protein